MATLITKVISMLLYTNLISTNNLLHNVIDCDYQRNIILCPEDIVVFVCSISGGVATIWRGSIFNCPNSGNQLLLRHRNFENGTSRTCNDGDIVAYSSEVTNISYSSRLNVTVTPEMHNGTIECIQPEEGSTVGTCTLILVTDLEPLYEVRVSDINPNELTIDWSRSQSPTSSCGSQTLIYNITTVNCGVCPNTTSDTSIRCTNLIATVSGQACSVGVQTQVDAGNNSEYSVATNLTVLLRVPSAPEITARWTNQFASILTSFNESEQFFISDGIDGSATNYTITYSVSDSTSGRTCDSVTIIPASACTQQTGICAHTLKINPSSPCLFSSSGVSVTVTVFATNVLGKGPISDPVVFVIPEWDVSDDRGNSGVALILTATVLIVILLLVSAVSVFLIVMVIILLRRYLRIKKELIKAKESSTYEEIDISAPASSIDTAENISYCPVSRK